MGSTSPSIFISRTKGPTEGWSALKEGISKRAAAPQSMQNAAEIAAHHFRLLLDAPLRNRNACFIAHLRPASCRPGWNFANAPRVVLPLRNWVPILAPSQLPHAREPASFARDKSSPAASGPLQNPVSPAKPAALSRHHPSCPGGG